MKHARKDINKDECNTKQSGMQMIHDEHKRRDMKDEKKGRTLS